MPSKERIKTSFIDKLLHSLSEEAGLDVKCIPNTEAYPAEEVSVPDVGVLTNNVHYINEGSNARQEPCDSEPFVVEHKAGRKRGERGVGRYPFLTWVNRYLDKREKTYSPTTVKEVRRRYRRMQEDLKGLVQSGEAQSANPEKMSADDVLAYIGLQKERGLKETATSHNITVLNSLLLFVGNTAVQQCKMKYPSAMPKKRTPRMDSMDLEDFHRIIAEARGVEVTDWTRLRSFAIVVLALCAGLRCKELRLSTVTDLNTSKWVIHVEHVKGEGTYGEPRRVAIRPEGRDILSKYLRARKAIVDKNCPKNQALFPAMRDEEDGFLSTNSIQKDKRMVESSTGIKFDLRMCRRTFCQMLIDEDLDTDSVSVMMGHASTKTTEAYYGRKRPEAAIREAQELWKGQKSYPDAKNPKIESRFEVTGYV